MPRYEDSPLPPELSVQEAIDWCDARMEHVARASADAASAALTGKEGGDGPLERRCRLHADVWKRLGEWLAVPAAVTDASDEVEAALVGAVRAIEASAVERDLPLPISEVGAAPAPSNGHRRFTRRMRYPRLTR
jgi:hypothetical protein